ncbi:iron complex transport system ATP-binding protein [Kaistella treverensis]|uniref:Iron complex transport system ATP-binding protein n=1 Tax=Kaistella treverensis TaxID=631455 RepID=A0A1I3K930_9FLAO|nr:ABC transporter ATP-binding protein [Kaistella treverensis]SFI69011.1 iron complex transport system ATP-binding protein [Kaistella treverensis]
MFLEIKNATIGYRTPLIKEVNTSLDLGEICLLIGNNGVGKTTLIKSILHQNSLLKGQIFIKSKNIKESSNQEIAESVAVVFSKSDIPLNYTLRDLVSFGKYIHYPYYFELNQTDKQEVEEIIKSLNLSSYADFPLQQLSDGNLQKAFIGRALAQNSPFVILDEPTTHLDEENKVIILKLLRNLAKVQNKLILFSSHDWRLAKEFADKIWLLNDQKIEAGIAEEILLKNDELLNPGLFDFTESFIPPKIAAPDLHKEMLYSFLQKNFPKNLSELEFTFQNRIWVISTDDLQINCASFTEIGQFLSKRY